MKKRQQWKMRFGLILFLSFFSWAEIYGDDITAAPVEANSSSSSPKVVTPAPPPAEENKVKKDAPAMEIKAAEAQGQEEEIQMLRGDLQTIKAHSLTRISVSNPEVADFSSVESDRVVMLAKKAGQTAVFLWDEHGKRTILVRVLEEDLNSLKLRLEAFLKTTHLEGVSFLVSAYEGKLLAIGDLPKDKKAEFTKMIAPFTSSVRDLVKEEVSEDLVQIDVELAQLSTDYTKILGLSWPSALEYDETVFSASIPRDIFKVSPLSRVTQIKATLNALITEGKGRVLSKPKLVVKSGKEASFLVGGQIPITTTTTTSGGNVQQNVEFKDYGINLTITPTIKNNRVDVIMRVNVSDPDTTAGLRNAQSVAFTTTSAQTQLFLNDKQTVILAGLIKHNESQSVSKVPFLGDIPLVGLAFRKKDNGPNKDTELVITLTPTIIRQIQEKANVPADQETAEKPPAQEKQKEAEPAKKVEAEPLKQEDLIAGYMKSIQEKISKSINYPFAAKEKGWTGVVKLSLHILKDGSLAQASVKESSGHSIFDKDALDTAQIAAPYDPFPESLKLDELMVTAPIVYGPPVPSTPADMAFAQAVQQRIADAIEYPDEAREYGWEGTVKVSLLILSDGTLAACSVKESSGHDLLDEAAVKTVKDLAPYTDFPSEPDLPELNITIPVVFSLEQE